VELGRFRQGLRVGDVSAAADFYRGLGFEVDGLDAAYAYCAQGGCEITSGPQLEPYGDRVFECFDPFGYLWELSQPVDGRSADEGVEAVREAWFGAPD
jgi:uncharacterized glyoxalase superfamily protein PhnB